MRRCGGEVTECPVVRMTGHEKRMSGEVGSVGYDVNSGFRTIIREIGPWARVSERELGKSCHAIDFVYP